MQALIKVTQEIITHLKICVSTHFASVPKLFGQLLVKSITSLFAQGGVICLYAMHSSICSAVRAFVFSQNIGIDIGGDVHIIDAVMYTQELNRIEKQNEESRREI